MDEVLGRLEDAAHGVDSTDLSTARKYCRELIDEQPSIDVDWNEAPEWANYHAVDADGEAWWYENEPRLLMSCWSEVWCGEIAKKGITNLEGINWQQTLTKRP